MTALTHKNRITDFPKDPEKLAQFLIGKTLVRYVDGLRLAGIIIETEAYLGPHDQASHTRNGHRSPRVESMYLLAGHAYVYFTYGMHHCFNITAGDPDEGSAVLIRALQPVAGTEFMVKQRPRARKTTDLCSGPGKLTQAFAIDLHLDGEDLRRSKQLLVEVTGEQGDTFSIVRTPRIGIQRAGEPWVSAPLRFVIENHPFASRP